MTLYPKKWDVVLIDFPYTDGSTTKKRPGAVFAVILNDLGQEDVIIAAITSQAGMSGIEIPNTHPEYANTGLRVPSRILPGKIFTCAKSEIRAILGKLGPALQAELRQRLLSTIVPPN